MSVARMIDHGRHADNVPVERALDEIRLRKRRESAFGREFFSDPVWDVLLELFVFRASGLDADADMVGLTATSRFLKVMQERGLVRRGARADSLTLTDEAFATMTGLMSA